MDHSRVENIRKHGIDNKKINLRTYHEICFRELKMQRIRTQQKDWEKIKINSKK